MRVREKANLTVSADAAGKDKLFALDDTASELVNDGFTELSSGTVPLTLDVAFDVPLGGVTTGRGLFLRATGLCEVSLNGAAAFNLRPGKADDTTAAANGKLMLDGDINTVVVTAKVAGVVLTYALWGL